MKTTLRTLTAAGSLVLLPLLPTVAPAQNAVEAWVQRYNGPRNGAGSANAIAVDASGNVYVAGSTADNAGYSDYATIKFERGGAPVDQPVQRPGQRL